MQGFNSYRSTTGWRDGVLSWRRRRGVVGVAFSSLPSATWTVANASWAACRYGVQYYLQARV